MHKYKYDVAVSFAGEQRDIAKGISDRLDASGYSVFYDEFEAAELWGADLTISLEDVYANQARYCFILVSQEYLAKPWTNLERQHAISRFMRERQGYVLCARFDEAHLPGLPAVVGYIDFERYGVDGIYKLLLTKLGHPDHAGQLSHLSEADRGLAREVIAACYRRSIFTNMQGEISHDAMYASIGEALGTVQRLVPRIEDPALQNVCLEIMAALDRIQRTKANPRIGYSGRSHRERIRHIDEQKLNVVRSLIEIRRAARISMQLPLNLVHGHFFTVEDADSPPYLGEIG